MSQKTYMYDTQWQALINAIDGGDTSAIATALGQIKTSVDGITTALSNLSTDVTQDTTQWTNLINAISSGGGGGGGNVTIDSTQWTNLLTSIDKGDTTALATALGLIKTSIDSINTSLGSLNVGVEQDATQWGNLVNAITNQSLTVDLSNVTSSAVSNLSNVTGLTVTDALDVLKSDLSDLSSTSTATFTWSQYFICTMVRVGKLRIITAYDGADTVNAGIIGQLNRADYPAVAISVKAWCLVGTNAYGSRTLSIDTNGQVTLDNAVARGGFTIAYYVV